jgi:hypothetical protein
VSAHVLLATPLLLRLWVQETAAAGSVAGGVRSAPGPPPFRHLQSSPGGLPCCPDQMTCTRRCREMPQLVPKEPGCLPAECLARLQPPPAVQQHLAAR